MCHLHAKVCFLWLSRTSERPAELPVHAGAQCWPEPPVWLLAAPLPPVTELFPLGLAPPFTGRQVCSSDPPHATPVVACGIKDQKEKEQEVFSETRVKTKGVHCEVLPGLGTSVRGRGWERLAHGGSLNLSATMPCVLVHLYC